MGSRYERGVDYVVWVVDSLEGVCPRGDQGGRFPPHGLLEPVPDESGQFAGQAQRALVGRRVERCQPVQGLRIGLFAAHDLDQRDEVRRIKRVADDAPLWVDAIRLQHRHRKPRCTRGNDDVGTSRAVDGGDGGAFTRTILWRVLLHHVGVGHGTGQVSVKGDPVRTGPWPRADPLQQRPYLIPHGEKRAACLWSRIEDVNVEAHPEIMERPTTADYSRADYPHPAHSVRRDSDRGSLLVDLGDAGKRAAALYPPQVAPPAAHGDGTQPVIPGRREHRCPAAEAVPDHGDPLPVNGWKVAILEVVDGRGYIRCYRPQVVPAAAAPAAPVMEHQRVPAAVAQFGSQVKVLFQTRAAMQQQDRVPWLGAPREEHEAEQIVPLAAEGDADQACVLRQPHQVSRVAQAALRPGVGRLVTDVFQAFEAEQPTRIRWSRDLK